MKLFIENKTRFTLKARKGKARTEPRPPSGKKLERKLAREARNAAREQEREQQKDKEWRERRDQRKAQ